MICRLLLIPTLGYFGDFGFFARSSGEKEAFAAVTEFLDMLGIELKAEKSVIGATNVFLGLTAFFPRPSNGMSLVISLPREKAHHWARMIQTIIANDTVPHATLESLIGRLSFAQTAVFGRLARAMMKPLYTKLYAPRFPPQLSPALVRNLQRWATTLLSMRPRVATLSRSGPDWVIYTDAAYEEAPNGAHIAAVFLKPEMGPRGRQIELILDSAPGPMDIEFFRPTSVIFGLELAAAALAIFSERKRLSGKAVTLYIDNNAALAALINGDSSSLAAFYLVDSLWRLVTAHNIAIWFERVESPRNIADLPTRNRPLPIPVLGTAPFPPLQDLINLYQQQIEQNSATWGGGQSEGDPFITHISE